MELNLITITLNGVSMLTVATTSAQPTGSLISGLVNNSSRDQVNNPDAVITNTEDEFIVETDIGPDHYQVMTCSHNVGASDMTRRGVINTKDAVLLPDHAKYPGIPIELTHKRGDTGIKIRQNMMHRKARTGGRCVNMLTTRISNSADADWASIFADAHGIAAWMIVMCRKWHKL